ncbi:MAG: hypothetical protein ABH854_05850 [Candidatus Diapherotrites archaeon]|nr:hypothetical protein [Candidatus Micrarchaeota archaeon]MBU1939451.1 hypothetical protein [Candidatus Micrarchaeota archaeon]
MKRKKKIRDIKTGKEGKVTASMAAGMIGLTPSQMLSAVKYDPALKEHVSKIGAYHYLDINYVLNNKEMLIEKARAADALEKKWRLRETRKKYATPKMLGRLLGIKINERLINEWVTDSPTGKQIVQIKKTGDGKRTEYLIPAEVLTPDIKEKIKKEIKEGLEWKGWRSRERKNKWSGEYANKRREKQKIIRGNYASATEFTQWLGLEISSRKKIFNLIGHGRIPIVWDSVEKQHLIPRSLMIPKNKVRLAAEAIMLWIDDKSGAEKARSRMRSRKKNRSKLKLTQAVDRILKQTNYRNPEDVEMLFSLGIKGREKFGRKGITFAKIEAFAMGTIKFGLKTDTRNINTIRTYLEHSVKYGIRQNFFRLLEKYAKYASK